MARCWSTTSRFASRQPRPGHVDDRPSRERLTQMAKRARAASKEKAPPAKPAKRAPRKRHSVYVVFLRNPKGDGKAGYYVGMTRLTPEQRLQNHLNGIKAARV